MAVRENIHKYLNCCGHLAPLRLHSHMTWTIKTQTVYFHKAAALGLQNDGKNRQGHHLPL